MVRMCHETVESSQLPYFERVCVRDPGYHKLLQSGAIPAVVVANLSGAGRDRRFSIRSHASVGAMDRRCGYDDNRMDWTVESGPGCSTSLSGELGGIFCIDL